MSKERTEEFVIDSGILQGDTLSSFLFIIFIDFCMRNAIAENHMELRFTLDRGKQ